MYLLIREISLFLRSDQDSIEQFPSWLAERPLIRTWDRRHVYQACLGRLPELEAGCVSWAYADRHECADHIVRSLLSAEFRTNALEIIGRAIPHIPRTFFVHVPRTGGSSVQRALEQGFRGVPWHESYRDDDWFARALERQKVSRLEFMLRFLAQFANPDAQLLVGGHLPISVLLSRNLVRTGDTLFTIIRAPEEIVLSNLEYILDTAGSNSDAPDALDWREWLRHFDIDPSSGAPPSAVDLSRLIRSERFRIEYGNPLSRYLSYDGKGSLADETLSMLACAILTIETAPSYLARALEVQVPLQRINGSSTSVRQVLDSATMSYIREVLCGQDAPIWGRHCSAGAQSDGTADRDCTVERSDMRFTEVPVAVGARLGRTAAD